MLGGIGEFTYHLTRFLIISTHCSSSINYADDSKHQGDIKYIPVSTTRWYWQLELDSINVAGQVAVTPPENYIKEAVIDTGSTLIAGPKADVEKFWST